MIGSDDAFTRRQQWWLDEFSSLCERKIMDTTELEIYKRLNRNNTQSHSSTY